MAFQEFPFQFGYAVMSVMALFPPVMLMGVRMGNRMSMECSVVEMRERMGMGVRMAAGQRIQDDENRTDGHDA